MCEHPLPPLTIIWSESVFVCVGGDTQVPKVMAPGVIQA